MNERFCLLIKRRASEEIVFYYACCYVLLPAYVCRKKSKSYGENVNIIIIYYTFDDARPSHRLRRRRNAAGARAYARICVLCCSPNNSSFMSLAACSPSSLRFLSICRLRARAARSSADMAQPIFRPTFARAEILMRAAIIRAAETYPPHSTTDRR